MQIDDEKKRMKKRKENRRYEIISTLELPLPSQKPTKHLHSPRFLSHSSINNLRPTRNPNVQFLTLSFCYDAHLYVSPPAPLSNLHLTNPNVSSLLHTAFIPWSKSHKRLMVPIKAGFNYIHTFVYIYSALYFR